MNITECSIEGVRIIVPDVHEDERGFFYESYHQDKYKKLINISENFVQDNHSKSSKGVLRGLHYQIEHPQGKLIRCTQGAVYDAFVDIRKHSETFGKSLGIVLDKPEQLLWIPPGFAHGFYTLSDTAEFEYKCTDYYYPQHQRTLMWNSVDIEWPLDGDPILSLKDTRGHSFEEFKKYD